MTDLSKSEYQVLHCFYDINQALTKHELLEKMPSLNKNTTAAVIRSLLEKGYLEVEEIRYSQNVLARAYRPGVSFIEFLEDEYGEVAIENLLKKAINSLENIHEIEYLLDLISKKENALIKNG